MSLARRYLYYLDTIRENMEMMGVKKTPNAEIIGGHWLVVATPNQDSAERKMFAKRL